MDKAYVRLLQREFSDYTDEQLSLIIEKLGVFAKASKDLSETAFTLSKREEVNLSSWTPEAKITRFTDNATSQEFQSTVVMTVGELCIRKGLTPDEFKVSAGYPELLSDISSDVLALWIREVS